MLELAVRMVLVGGIVIVGLLALRRANARGLTARGGPVLRVVSRTGLTRTALVAVVEVDDRRFLVGASEQGVQLLGELDRAPVDAVDTAAIDLDDLELLDVLDPDVPTTDHLAAHWTGRTTTGPRIGPLDRLRELTVRTPLREPIRAPRPARD